MLVANFDFSPLKWSKDTQMAHKRDLMARIEALPGITSVAETLIVPMSHSGWDDNIDVPDGLQRQDVTFNRVSPGYFRTMETPLLAGRDFNDTDTPRSPAVAIVNEFFARKFFGTANPLGRRYFTTLRNPIRSTGLSALPPTANITSCARSPYPLLSSRSRKPAGRKRIRR